MLPCLLWSNGCENLQMYLTINRHRYCIPAIVLSCGLMLCGHSYGQDIAECNGEMMPERAVLVSDGKGISGVINTIKGRVSYYGREFGGRKTAAGERFDPTAHTMAHPTLPFGTLVRVTNLLNNMSVVVRVNDRGPSTGGRVADVSAGAAQALGMLRAGVVDAVLEVVNLMDRRKRD